MEEVEEELSFLSNLVNIEIGRREKRPICDNCRRPAGVCWCRGLAGQQVSVRSRVVVLQHPHEEKRCLRTAPILKAALPPQHYLELRGKRFSLARHPELSPILSSGCTILMYPGEGARGVEDLPRVGDRMGGREEDEVGGGGVEKDQGGVEAGQKGGCGGQDGGCEGQRRGEGVETGQDGGCDGQGRGEVETGQDGACDGQGRGGGVETGQDGGCDGRGGGCEVRGAGQRQPPYNIVILDGTWQQAKSIYHNCPCLHTLPQVCLSGRYTSEYIIRTQPTDDALSTVETAALALAILEGDWSIYNTLVEPLRVLCRFQLSHGAVPHQSKEHMLVSGRCCRPLGKRTYKKLKKCGARYPHALAALLMGGGGGGGDENGDDVKDIVPVCYGGDGDSGDGDSGVVNAVSCVSGGGDSTGGDETASAGNKEDDWKEEEELGNEKKDEETGKKESKAREKRNNDKKIKYKSDNTNGEEIEEKSKKNIVENGGNEGGGEEEERKGIEDDKAGRGQGGDERKGIEKNEKGRRERGRSGGGGEGERKDIETDEKGRGGQVGDKREEIDKYEKGGGGGEGERREREKEEKEDCIPKVKRNISSHVPWELR